MVGYYDCLSYDEVMTFPRQRLVILGLIFTIMLFGVASWRLGMTDEHSRANQQTDNLATPSPSPTPAYLAPGQIPTITLEQILNQAPAVDLNLLDPDQLRTIVVTGDVIPARGVDAKVRQYGPTYPFAGEGIAELLQSGDLTIVDLEAPVLTNCPVHNEGFTFCGQASFAQAMADAGIDVATLENNHIGNYGQAGITETISHLESAGVDYATSSRLSVANMRGLKVGTLAFTGVGGMFYPGVIKEAVASARPQVDLLLVAFHWGKEYELIPTADPNIAPDDPRIIAQLTIESGADFIIGNHPHWVQGIELIDNKLVNYAYGNFIFDQSWSQETLQGYVGEYVFYGSKLVQVKMYPTLIRSQSQPYVVGSDDAQIIMDRIKQSSQTLASSPLNRD